METAPLVTYSSVLTEQFVSQGYISEAFQFGSLPPVVGAPGILGVVTAEEPEPEMIDCLVHLDEDVLEEQEALDQLLKDASEQSNPGAAQEDFVPMPSDESVPVFVKMSRSRKSVMVGDNRIFLNNPIRDVKKKIESLIPCSNSFQPLWEERKRDWKLSRKEKRALKAAQPEQTAASLRPRMMNRPKRKNVPKKKNPLPLELLSAIAARTGAPQPQFPQNKPDERIPVIIPTPTYPCRKRPLTLGSYAGSVREDQLVGAEESATARQLRLERRNQAREAAAEARRLAEQRAKELQELEESDDDDLASEPIIQSPRGFPNLTEVSPDDAANPTVQMLQRQILQLQESLAQATLHLPPRKISTSSRVCEPPQSPAVPFYPYHNPYANTNPYPTFEADEGMSSE